MAASSFALSFPTEKAFSWADDVEEEIAQKAADEKHNSSADEVEENPEDLPLAQYMGEPASNNDSDSDSDSDTTTTAPMTPRPYDHEYYIGYLTTVDILGPKGYRLAATFHDGDMVLNDNGRRVCPQPVLWKRSYLSLVENIDEDTEQPPPPIASLPLLPAVADTPSPMLPLPALPVAALDPPPSPPISLIVPPPLTTPEPPMLPLPLPIPPPAISEPPKPAAKPYLATATFLAALMAFGLFEVLVTKLIG